MPRFLLMFFTVALLEFGFAANAAACLQGEYARLSFKCETEPAFQKLLRVIFPEASEPLRIAVISAISEYKNLPQNRQLPAAASDAEMMTDLFANSLGYDEVILVRNKDFNVDSLRYLFEIYLPDRLNDHKNSQVVFAFSGHGADFDGRGYLFTHDTMDIEIKNYTQARDAISLSLLKTILEPTVGTAHQFIALLNSCNGGHFLSQSAQVFGLNIEEKGAHGITAGGANDLVYARTTVGTGEGSVFFEMVNSALRGQTIVINGGLHAPGVENDGVLSFGELSTFLHSTISAIENHRISPRADRIFPSSPGNQGEIFFILDEEKAKTWFAKNYPRGFATVFGGPSQEDSNMGTSEAGDRIVASIENVSTEDQGTSSASTQHGRDQLATLQGYVDQAQNFAPRLSPFPSTLVSHAMNSYLDLPNFRFRFDSESASESEFNTSCTDDLTFIEVGKTIYSMAMFAEFIVRLIQQHADYYINQPRGGRIGGHRYFGRDLLGRFLLYSNDDDQYTAVDNLVTILPDKLKERLLTTTRTMLQTYEVFSQHEHLLPKLRPNWTLEGQYYNIGFPRRLSQCFSKSVSFYGDVFDWNEGKGYSFELRVGVEEYFYSFFHRRMIDESLNDVLSLITYLQASLLKRT